MIKSSICKFVVLLVCFLSLSCSRNSNINLDSVADTPVSPLACDSSLLSSYGGGTGTTLDPYAICSVSQWNYLASDSANWGKSFKLYSDLDFTGVLLAGFHSVGDATTAFTGTFDGNNFKILNLNITGTTENLALFKKTDGNVMIQNLTLKNITLESNVRIAGLILDHGSGGTLSLINLTLDSATFKMHGACHRAGGLVATSASPVNMSNIAVSNITFTTPPGTSRQWGTLLGFGTSAITISNISGANIVFSGNLQQSGGLVGQVDSTASFTDVTLSGLSLSASSGMGGVIYQADSTATFTRVRAAGTVSGNTDAGGLISVNNGATNPSIVIIDSSFTGPVNGSFWSGGLVGLSYDKDVSITRSFYKGAVNSVWSGKGGGLIGSSQAATANINITDSYSVADLRNNHVTDYLIGGLIGGSYGNVTITRAYAAGALNGTAPRACIGKTASALSFVTADTYYDSTLCTATASTSGAIAGSTGLATASLQTATPFTNWSPSVWVFTSGQNPKLIWEP